MGAKDQAQQCQCAIALKGRVKRASQQCQNGHTLPDQFMEAKNPPQERHPDTASTS
jgi:hypothetical protein